MGFSDDLKSNLPSTRKGFTKPEKTRGNISLFSSLTANYITHFLFLFSISLRCSTFYRCQWKQTFVQIHSYIYINIQWHLFKSVEGSIFLQMKYYVPILFSIVTDCITTESNYFNRYIHIKGIFVDTPYHLRYFIKIIYLYFHLPSTNVIYKGL